MGNYINYSGGKRSASTGKVISSDGSIQEFDTPITVAELMLEHPQQVVVELKKFNPKRPIPLPADKNLELKKFYLLLPYKRGKPIPLTVEQARLILSNAMKTQTQSLFSSSKFLTLLGKLCSSNLDNRTELLEMKKKVIEKEKRLPEVEVVDRWVSLSDLSPESIEGRPEFLSRQVSGKAWKPSLDTITEKRVENKVTHWLY